MTEAEGKGLKSVRCDYSTASERQWSQIIMQPYSAKLKPKQAPHNPFSALLGSHLGLGGCMASLGFMKQAALFCDGAGWKTFILATRRQKFLPLQKLLLHELRPIHLASQEDMHHSCKIV